MKLDIPTFNSLEKLLIRSTEMEKVGRWDKYVENEEAKPENTLQHTYKAALLSILIIDNEKRYILENGGSNFDDYLVLKAILLHDLGEIDAGDTLYIDKNLKADLEEITGFEKLISDLSKDSKKDLFLAYTLQYIGKAGHERVTPELEEKYHYEIRLFDAIERLGYVIFAYRQFRRDGNEKILVQTLRNQHHILARLSEELPGFGNRFYTPEIRQSLEEFIGQYDGKFIEQKKKLSS